MRNVLIRPSPFESVEAWSSFVERVAEALAKAVEEYCLRYDRDDPAGCMASFMLEDPLELAVRFSERVYPWSPVTETYVSLIADMPTPVYRRLADRLQDKLRKMVESYLD